MELILNLLRNRHLTVQNYVTFMNTKQCCPGACCRGACGAQCGTRGGCSVAYCIPLYSALCAPAAAAAATLSPSPPPPRRWRAHGTALRNETYNRSPQTLQKFAYAFITNSEERKSLIDITNSHLSSSFTISKARPPNGAPDGTETTTIFSFHSSYSPGRKGLVCTKNLLENI